MVQQELVAPVIENKSTDPLHALAGQLYYNDVINKLEVYNGNTFKEILTEDNLETISFPVNAETTVYLDSVDNAIENTIIWTISAVSGSSNKLTALINVLQDGVKTYDSGLYALVSIGTANSDLNFSTILSSGAVQLQCINSSLNNYNVKILREIL